MQGTDTTSRKRSRAKTPATPNQPADMPSLPDLLAAMAEKSTRRFKAAKELQLLSKTHPEILYSHFSIFAGLLDNASSVMLWNGIIILAHLAKVDSEHRFDAIFTRYYAHLWDGKLITAANILGNSGYVIKYRPDLTDRIIPELLSADDIPLPTPTCREVARGSVLASLSECLPQVKNDHRVLDFIVRCTDSFRPTVKKKAELLLPLMRQA